MLTKCKTCGKEVSQTAKICPHCGQKDPGVKTLYIVIAVIIITLMILVGIKSCGKDSPKNLEQTTQVIQNEQSNDESITSTLNQPSHNFDVTLDDFTYSYNKLLNNYKKEFGKNVITSLKIDPKFMYEGGFGDVYTLVDAKSKVVDVNMTAVIDKNNKKLEGLTFKFLDKSNTKNTKNAVSMVGTVLLIDIINSLDIHGEDADNLMHRLLTEYKTTNGRLITELTYNKMKFFFVMVEVGGKIHYELTVD